MSSILPKANGASAILSQAQLLQLQQLSASLDVPQLTWLSGYFAGLAQSNDPEMVLPLADKSEQKALTILYGSQTGNAKAIAQEYKASLDAAGLPAKISNLADYKLKQLKTESHIVVVVSTHGEGDAPDDAVEFHEFLASKKAPKLPHLQYSVLGLGDSSYEFFCQTAKDIDQRLANLGARQVVGRVDCDVDYDTAAQDWSALVTEKIKDELLVKASSQVVPISSANKPHLAPDSTQYTKKNPFAATLLESQKITGRDSVKDIRHIEISLEGSGLHYRPGDALGVWFCNSDQLVSELLSILKITADSSVEYSAETFSIEEVLKDKLELTQSYPTFVQRYNNFAKSTSLEALLADKAALRAFLAERQIIDIVREFPCAISAQDLVDSLRSMIPRLYSIASCQAEVEDEVHLTVAVVEYDAHGHHHEGGASSFLAKRLDEGGEVKVFIEENNNFRLPEAGDTDVIMVGPGTGIAPFRAFLQQREADEVAGQNWLFFGNPNYTQDFLYQTEWQRFVKDGVLSKLSLAFSRDQEQKIYVQHRLLEQGAEIYQWLESGAHFYVCGDANHMAKDVDQALLSIVQEHGKKSEEEAQHYITGLRKAKRYQKDVY